MAFVLQEVRGGENVGPCGHLISINLFVQDFNSKTILML